VASEQGASAANVEPLTSLRTAVADAHPHMPVLVSSPVVVEPQETQNSRSSLADLPPEMQLTQGGFGLVEVTPV